MYLCLGRCTSRICRISFLLVSANGDLSIPNILAMSKENQTFSIWQSSYVRQVYFVFGIKYEKITCAMCVIWQKILNA